MQTNIKNSFIILFSIILLILVIFFAIKLLSINYNQEQINLETQNQKFPAISKIIIDGDTFETADGEIIRLLCVDTPEKGKIGYEEAKNYLSTLILTENIMIERKGLDKYNRTLAWVSIEIDKKNVLVNKEIVDNGFGDIFEYNGTDCQRMK